MKLFLLISTCLVLFVVGHKMNRGNDHWDDVDWTRQDVWDKYREEWEKWNRFNDSRCTEMQTAHWCESALRSLTKNEVNGMKSSKWRPLLQWCTLNDKPNTQITSDNGNQPSSTSVSGSPKPPVSNVCQYPKPPGSYSTTYKLILSGQLSSFDSNAFVQRIICLVQFYSSIESTSASSVSTTFTIYTSNYDEQRLATYRLIVGCNTIPGAMCDTLFIINSKSNNRDSNSTKFFDFKFFLIIIISVISVFAASVLFFCICLRRKKAKNDALKKAYNTQMAAVHGIPLEMVGLSVANAKTPDCTPANDKDVVLSV